MRLAWGKASPAIALQGRRLKGAPLIGFGALCLEQRWPMECQHQRAARYRVVPKQGAAIVARCVPTLLEHKRTGPGAGFDASSLTTLQRSPHASAFAAVQVYRWTLGTNVEVVDLTVLEVEHLKFCVALVDRYLLLGISMGDRRFFFVLARQKRAKRSVAMSKG